MSSHGAPKWRTSSYTANGSNCVEVALTADDALVRDSKAPQGGNLAVSSVSWAKFVDDVK